MTDKMCEKRTRSTGKEETPSRLFHFVDDIHHPSSLSFLLSKHDGLVFCKEEGLLCWLRGEREEGFVLASSVSLLVESLVDTVEDLLGITLVRSSTRKQKEVLFFSTSRLGSS